MVTMVLTDVIKPTSWQQGKQHLVLYSQQSWGQLHCQTPSVVTFGPLLPELSPEPDFPVSQHFSEVLGIIFINSFSCLVGTNMLFFFTTKNSDLNAIYEKIMIQ
jgi:hypothetical protein